MLMPLEAEAFAAAVKAIDTVSDALSRTESQLMHSAFEHLSGTFAFQSHMVQEGNAAAQRAFQGSGDAISARLFGYLSTARLFLDHSAHALSKAFGKNSPQARDFVRATHWAYDRSVGYRFCDQLRNAYQHAGSPPLHLSIATDDELGKPSLTLSADRDELLSYYEWKRAVREDIQAMGASIDIYALLSGARMQMEYLASVARRAFDDAAAPAAEHLRALIRDLDGPLTELALISIEREDRDRLQIRQHGPTLAAIDSLRAPRPSTHSELEPQTCLGQRRTGTPCSFPVSNLVFSPHRNGTVALPVCDLHLRDASIWCVRRLGAAMPLHPMLWQYMSDGLARAGHESHLASEWSPVLELQRSDEELPDLALDLDPSGWRVPRHPEIVRRIRLAITALSVWHSEGGGTPAYIEELRRLVDDENDVEPLLTGLISLSETMLAHVAALQASAPDAILGRLGEDLDRADLHRDTFSGPDPDAADTDQSPT